MDKVIEYLKNYEKLTTITLIVLAILLVLVVFIVLARKAVKKKRQYKKEVDEASIALSLMTDQHSDDVACNDIESVDSASSDNSSIDVKREEITIKAPIDKITNEQKTAALEDEKIQDVNELKSQDLDGVTADENEKDDLSKKTAKYSGQQSKKSANKPINDNNGEIKDSAATTKKAVKKDSEVQKTPTKTKYAGKWLIYAEGGKYAANLVASNGEVLLRTEFYSALSGIKSGIETIKNNIAKDNFAISMDKNENYFFKLFSSSTRLLCISEGYSSKSVCESAIESVKRFAKTAVLEIKKDEE